MTCRPPLAAMLVLLAACSRIDAPQQNGELVVAIRNGPAFYRDDGEAAKGFEHDVIEAFARELGVKARFVVVADPVELVAMLRAGSVHLAASLPVGAPLDGIRYSPPLRRAREILVRHADSVGLEDPARRRTEAVEVVAGSPIAAVLKASSGESGRAVIERAGENDIDLLARVADRRVMLAATDTLHYRIAANYFPDLRVAEQLPGRMDLAWGFADDGDDYLYDKAKQFIRRLDHDGTLTRLEDRYFGHLKRLAPPDAMGILERMHSVLPHFRHEFESAQEITGIDWRLLAALAYQESNWDPLATSPTGVRGMMMLTEETADLMNVGDRLDPKQSIIAGAKYLADLLDQLPRTIAEQDRLCLALAAYNLGMGHLNGARAIAAGMNRSPDSWFDMKQVLPLMSRPEYYSRLKSGPARGGEAVIMVENVRSYYDIIRRFEPAYVPTRLTLR